MTIPEGPGEIPMNHLVQRFAELKAGLRITMAGVRINMPVTTRPIRAAQTGIGKAHPRTQHDHRRREQRARQCQPPEPEQTPLWVHALAYVGKSQ